MHMFDRAAVEQLLQDTESLIRAEENAPIHDYHTLKMAVIKKELVQEVAALKAMLNKPNIEAAFRDRCRARALQNDNTCLSFTAMPHGVCNELYWKLALQFEPQTFYEMLLLLAPQITTYIMSEVDESRHPAKTRADFHNLTVKDHTLTSMRTSGELREDYETSLLSKPPTLDAFSQLVLSGPHLLEVANIAAFNFTLHRSYYQELHRKHPNLATSLYQHNSAMKTLSERLVLVTGKSQTPSQVIELFIRDLKIGGESVTGDQYASLGAQQAFTEFMVYIESLPNDIKTRLLSLCTNDGTSIQNVIEHLKKENCVEIAANILQKILQNPVNRDVLNQQVSLSQEKLRQIRKDYGPEKPLDITAQPSITTLPGVLLEEIIRHNPLQIQTPYELISVLLSFPPNLYSLLLRPPQILRKLALSEVWYSTVVYAVNTALNREQRQAFYEALFDHESLLGRQWILDFMKCTTTHDNLPWILKKISENERISFITFQYRRGDTWLHSRSLMRDPNVLQEVLNLIPKQKLETILQQTNNSGYTVFDQASVHPESLKIILALTSKETYLSAIKNNVRALLLAALLHTESLRLILDLYPSETERLEAMHPIDHYGTLLHTATHNHCSPASLHLLLGVYPNDALRLEAVRLKNPYNHTVLHSAALSIPDNGELLDILLNLYPAGDRLNALKEKTKMGRTVLDLVRTKPNKLRTVLASLTPVERLAVIMEKNWLGETMLHRAYANPELLTVILQSIPEGQRCQVVREKNRLGNTVLHQASANRRLPFILVAWLLILISVATAITTGIAILLFHSGHRTALLKWVAPKPLSCQAIIEALPEGDRAEALGVKNSVGRKVSSYFKTLGLTPTKSSSSTTLASTDEASTVEPIPVSTVSTPLPSIAPSEDTTKTTTIRLAPPKIPATNNHYEQAQDLEELEGSCCSLLNQLNRAIEDSTLKRMVTVIEEARINMKHFPLRDLQRIAQVTIEEYRYTPPTFFSDIKKTNHAIILDLCHIMAQPDFIENKNKLSSLVYTLEHSFSTLNQSPTI